MELMEFDCRYYDGKNFIMGSHYRYKVLGRLIDIPKGFITDLASVPRIFKNIVNSYGKNYTRAAVVHDYLYSVGYKLGISRLEADKIFLEIMKERGVGLIKRQAMYRAVRLFGALHYRKGA